MHNHDHTPAELVPGGGFWQSPTGIALIVFLLIAAILMGYEHRVHLFGGTSGSVVFLAAWFGLHFFMHRSHGSHGGHGASPAEPRDGSVQGADQDSGDRP